MIDVITVRGTGEIWNSRGNMLANVTSKLDVERFRSIDLQYPASVGPAGGRLTGASEAINVDAGVEDLAATIRHTPNVAGLLGYSLGAMVISRFLERKAAGEFTDCEVAFAGLVANPLRRQGESVDQLGTGYGIAGQREPGPTRIPVFEIANPSDGITCCPAGSPLHALADQVATFSLGDLTAWRADTRDVHDLINAARYREAIALIEGYLAPAPWGQHTAYNHVTMPGQRPGVTYCDRLAQLINEGPWR